jgi:3-oxoacyl-[acyl-carrier protein] reductase
MFEQLFRTWGRIDVLVNNAGIVRDTLLLRMSDDDWDAVVDTNLRSAFLCTKAASRQMLRQRSGRIINIASISGIRGNAGQANYAASKAGLIGFTKTVAREVASRGITVNAVAPGLIETDITTAMPAKARDAIVEQIPLGRMGTPEEVAAVVTFLASPEAGYITGQAIVLDGGLVM